MRTYRVRWEFDDAPDLSHLEQWDTPQKYKGNEVMKDGKPMESFRYYKGAPDGVGSGRRR